MALIALLVGAALALPQLFVWSPSLVLFTGGLVLMVGGAVSLADRDQRR
jgi:hypothetical protein